MYTVCCSLVVFQWCKIGRQKKKKTMFHTHLRGNEWRICNGRQFHPSSSPLRSFFFQYTAFPNWNKFFHQTDILWSYIPDRNRRARTWLENWKNEGRMWRMTVVVSFPIPPREATQSTCLILELILWRSCQRGLETHGVYLQRLTWVKNNWNGCQINFWGVGRVSLSSNSRLVMYCDNHDATATIHEPNESFTFLSWYEYHLWNSSKRDGTKATRTKTHSNEMTTFLESHCFQSTLTSKFNFEVTCKGCKSTNTLHTCPMPTQRSTKTYKVRRTRLRGHRQTEVVTRSKCTHRRRIGPR